MDVFWRDKFNEISRQSPTDGMIFLRAEVAAQPENLELLFELALSYKKLFFLENAIGVLIPISRTEGHHLRLRALLELGECFASLASIQGAELAYQQAYEIDPGSHWPILGMAKNAYSQSGAEAASKIVAKYFDKLRSDNKASILRYLSGIKAEEKYNFARKNPQWKIHQATEIPALASAVMLMMIKDEEDIIGQNLRHHYAMGFRRFCILDNESTDKTSSIIGEFRAEFTQACVIYIHDPIAGYYQSAKMIAAERLIEAYMEITGTKPTWLFFIDADEFITFAGGEDSHDQPSRLNAILAEHKFNLLILHWVNCASNGIIMQLDQNADPFIVFQKTWSALNPQVPKIAYRTGQGLQPMMGNHFVPEYDYGIDQVIDGSDFELYIMHFPLRSLQQVRKKVINGGQAYMAANGLDEHGDHWRKRYALFQNHGDSVIQQFLANHIRETK